MSEQARVWSGVEFRRRYRAAMVRAAMLEAFAGELREDERQLGDARRGAAARHVETEARAARGEALDALDEFLRQRREIEGAART